MRKCCLPKIKKSKLEKPSLEKSLDFTSHFSSLLKQFKLKDKKLKSKNTPISTTNPDYTLTEPNRKRSEPNRKRSFDTYEQNFLKKEEDKILIEGQKYLIKLYESNHTSLMDRIKNETKNEENNSPKSLKTPKKLEVFPYLNKNDKTKENADIIETLDDNDFIDNTEEKVNETLSNEGRSSSIKNKYGLNLFKKTKYVDPTCMRDFFDKYSKFNAVSRKYILKNDTPSLAFIKSSNEKKIVPNPLGLLRRTGDAEKLNFNFQKVGDNYMNVLSNSLKYSEHLTKLDLNGNRLSNDGVSKIFKVINDNSVLANKLQSIDLSENNFGNQNLEDFILYIQDSNNSLENLNIYGNLIGKENTIRICESLGRYIGHRLNSLNLGKNNIHDDCVPSINSMLKLCTGLRILNLSHNWLHNKPASQIINSLNNNLELKILDISWNLIGDDLTTIPSYEELVNSEIKHPDKNFDNFALNEALGSLKLKLRRNPLLPPIEDKTKKEKNDKNNKEEPNMADEIKEPKKIPSKPKNPSDFAVALGEYFANVSMDLIHLDISHNNINYEDCKLLSEKVKLNHTLLGIHLDGNEMEINALGFINAIEKNSKNNKYFSESQITYGIDKIYQLRKTSIDKVRKIRSKNNCWICDGFREIEFEYVPEKPIEDPNNHLVKIHLNFDNYKSFDMIYNDGKYHMARMCPPGDIYYFFSIDTELIKNEGKEGKNEFKKIPYSSEYINYTFDEEYMEELKNAKEKLTYEIREFRRASLAGNMSGNSNSNLIDLSKLPTTDKSRRKRKSIVLLNTNQNINIKVDTICKMNIKYNNKVIDENYRKFFKFSIPRPEKIINKFIKPRTPWTFPVSIWAYYGYDYNDISNSYLNQCFKFDFDRCQFNKDFKTEEALDDLKLFLKQRYRNIIDCYKYYSSLSGFSVWQITQNNLSEFINHCNDFCDKNYDINNVFLTQKTVCGNLIDKEDRKKKNKNLSDNIVRHQFLNLLVRVSKDKYITVLKTLSDPMEAVRTAFIDHFDEAIKGFEYHKWRQERYYNEKVDNFLKTYLPILDALYLSWAKQKGPTKKETWMVLEEFNNLIQNLVDVNEYPIRENPYIFNISINLQINEIYTDKHLNMFLPEFLEALCRAIDKASPYPPSENKEDWPMSKRKEQPLVNKLENILPVLMKLITHPDYKVLKDKFPIPTKDISTGLYVPNFESQFYKGYKIKTKEENNDLDIKFEEENEEGNEDSENSSSESDASEKENKKKNDNDNGGEAKKDKEIEKNDKGEIIDKKANNDDIINMMRNEIQTEIDNDNSEKNVINDKKTNEENNNIDNNNG